MNRRNLLLTSALLLGFTSPVYANNIVSISPIEPLLKATQPALKISTSNLEGAKSFVGSVADEGIGFLSSPDLSQEQRKEKFRSLLKKSFDLKTIARFTLGRYWRTASDAQKKEYMSLFEKMVLDIYAERFGEYSGETLSVNDARPEGQKDVLVHSSISSESSNQPIKVDWRLRSKNGQFKVIDVIVEGVSMSVTQRSDFASVIQRGGGDIEVLLAHLREK